MNLIEAYVYEVTRRLPEKMRGDIALELTSTIEDMLPENFTEQEVMEVLSKLGDPAQLAASYRDTPMYLIGPKVYDAYIWTMKMIIPWAILITILVHVVETHCSFFRRRKYTICCDKKLWRSLSAISYMCLSKHSFGSPSYLLFIERVGLQKAMFR